LHGEEGEEKGHATRGKGQSCTGKRNIGIADKGAGEVLDWNQMARFCSQREVTLGRLPTVSKEEAKIGKEFKKVRGCSRGERKKRILLLEGKKSHEEGEQQRKGFVKGGKEEKKSFRTRRQGFGGRPKWGGMGSSV